MLFIGKLLICIVDLCGFSQYHFPSGTQEAHHPHPGRPFHGTSREAFLPDTDEGREVLELLNLCFEYKSVFTIGTSVTTGAADCVVWNGVHHKVRNK
jgi:deltex